MKKMRKLIPAFAMLLVSAIMMSTASFAWFTMSAEVTASGMTVQAQAVGGLVMSAEKVDAASGARSTPTVNDYYTSVDFTDTSKSWYTNGGFKLFPTSTDGTHWYKADAASADSNAANATTYETLPQTGFTANASYYLATKLYFMAASEGTHTLEVSDVTVESSSTTNALLNKALRVAMKIGNQWFYFAPNYDASSVESDTFTLVHTTSTTDQEQNKTYDTAEYAFGSAAGQMTVGAIPTGDSVVLANNLTDRTALEVEVYIYYEGEDENCKSAYAINIQELTVSLSFKTNPVDDGE